MTVRRNKISSPSVDDTGSSLDDAQGCRRLWCAVLHSVLVDYWREVKAWETGKARIGRDNVRRDTRLTRSIDAIRRDALRYFRSRDGRTVMSLAGIEADPERMADAAIDLTAADRMLFETSGAARARMTRA